MTRLQHKILGEVIELPNLKIPLWVYYDRHQRARVRLHQDRAVLTLPIITDIKGKEKCIQWAIQWLEKKQNKLFVAQHEPLPWRDGAVLRLMEQDFHLRILSSEPGGKRAAATCHNNTITVTIPQDWDLVDSSLAIRSCLRNLIKRKMELPLAQRVHLLNEKYFQFHINQIKLKYNKSNWGSCSSKGNLNFSVRLLFAPLQVIDSVIIHELVHFKHMNHSTAFWQMVSQFDPHMKSSELWLKKHALTEFI